jgi:hypothetical protein
LPGAIDPVLLRPSQDRHAGQLGAVVGDASEGAAARGDYGIQFPRHAPAGQRRNRHQAQALAREVVDDGQDAEPPSIGQDVAVKVERLAVIGRPRHVGAFAAQQNLQTPVGHERQHRRATRLR